MAEIWKSKCGAIELRLGRWQDVLQDVTCDALITDPPYSDRTHTGQRTGSSIRVATIDFKSIGNMPKEIAEHWSKQCRWAVIFGDHQSFVMHEKAWEDNNWMVFAPVPWVKPDAPPRFSGDGPSCDAEWIMVAARRERRNCGSIRGHYISSTGKGHGRTDTDGFPTAKPLHLMRRVIVDYSRPGDLIVDPCAGSGTTLIASAIEGRRAIGAEMDPNTYLKAVHRLEKGWTPATLFQCGPEMKQNKLL